MAGKVGGARPGAGRPPGKLNKARREIASSARAVGERALAVLIEVMEDRAASARDRVTAATAILDRGYGKPHQSVALEDGDGGPLRVVIERYSGDDPAA